MRSFYATLTSKSTRGLGRCLVMQVGGAFTLVLENGTRHTLSFGEWICEVEVGQIVPA